MKIDLNALDPYARLAVEHLQRENAKLSEQHGDLTAKHATMSQQLGREVAHAQVREHYLRAGVPIERAADLALLAVNRTGVAFDDDGRPTRGGSVVEIADVVKTFESENRATVQNFSTPAGAASGSRHSGTPRDPSGGAQLPASGELHSGNVNGLLQAGFSKMDLSAGGKFTQPR